MHLNGEELAQTQRSPGFFSAYRVASPCGDATHAYILPSRNPAAAEAGG